VDPKLEQGIRSNLKDLLAYVPDEHRAEAELKAAEIEEQVNEVDKPAYTHDITGLPNQRAMAGRYSLDLALNAKTADEIAAERREVSPPRVLGWWVEYIDLNHFKEVNDSMGHHQGNRLLRYAAQAILRSVRPNIDEVYHPHGDEFVVFAPMFKPPVQGFSLKDLLNPRIHNEIAGFQTGEGRKNIPEGMRLTKKDRISLELLGWTIGEVYIKGPSINRRREERKADARMQALKQHSR
jgi:GGDEF domain-containing protein